MDEKLKKIEKISLALTLIFSIISIFWWNKAIFLGVLVGGALVTVNFFFLAKIVGGAMQNSKKKNLNSFLYFIKVIVFFSIAYLSFKYLPINHLAFFAGISILFIAVIAELIWKALTKKEN